MLDQVKEIHRLLNFKPKGTPDYGGFVLLPALDNHLSPNQVKVWDHLMVVQLLGEFIVNIHTINHSFAYMAHELDPAVLQSLPTPLATSWVILDINTSVRYSYNSRLAPTPWAQSFLKQAIQYVTQNGNMEDDQGGGNQSIYRCEINTNGISIRTPYEFYKYVQKTCYSASFDNISVNSANAVIPVRFFSSIVCFTKGYRRFDVELSSEMGKQVTSPLMGPKKPEYTLRPGAGVPNGSHPP